VEGHCAVSVTSVIVEFVCSSAQLAAAYSKYKERRLVVVVHSGFSWKGPADMRCCGCCSKCQDLAFFLSNQHHGVALSHHHMCGPVPGQSHETRPAIMKQLQPF
jgi:hypothetical protein